MWLLPLVQYLLSWCGFPAWDVPANDPRISRLLFVTFRDPGHETTWWSAAKAGAVRWAELASLSGFLLYAAAWYLWGPNSPAAAAAAAAGKQPPPPPPLGLPLWDGCERPDVDVPLQAAASAVALGWALAAPGSFEARHDWVMGCLRLASTASAVGFRHWACERWDAKRTPPPASSSSSSSPSLERGLASPGCGEAGAGGGEGGGEGGGGDEGGGLMSMLGGIVWRSGALGRASDAIRFPLRFKHHLAMQSAAVAAIGLWNWRGCAVCGEMALDVNDDGSSGGDGELDGGGGELDDGGGADGGEGDDVIYGICGTLGVMMTGVYVDCERVGIVAACLAAHLQLGVLLGLILPSACVYGLEMASRTAYLKKVD